jgi:hypothetical protein
MRAVNLHAVKSQPLCRERSLTKGANHIVDILLRHWLSNLLAPNGKPGRTYRARWNLST